LLVDPPPNVDAVDKAEAWKTNQLQVRSPHAAAYFPRLRMSDPLSPGSLRAYPPSGSMAGVMARTDANRGVWKSPAGVDATIAGVHAPAVLMSDEEHGILNPIGLNCVRKFPIYGSVSFGARTLVGSDAEADQWKYVAVRRTASFILLSLQRGLTWVTFMGNDEPLWAQIRMNVTTFMQGLFRQGAFQGRSPREAYLVKCDAETTQPADVAAGVVNVVVGFSPLRPAEFVFVTLRQLAGQSQA
jgi:phage tail sheath protein FI